LPKGPADTTHISIIDKEGNVVGITTSAGEGAGFMIADTGVAMNNILGEVDLHPNGFHKSPPKTRLQTMMSPTIVLKDDKPVLVLGSGGSTRLRSAIVQVLSNVLDLGLPLAEAVNLPRIHFEEDVLQLEGGLPTDIPVKLAKLGYQVNVWPGKNMYFGGVHTVGILSGEWTAVGDPRRGGYSQAVD
jgi:gamma-glutamyltranspeptidase/glutathione hydrolase